MKTCCHLPDLKRLVSMYHHRVDYPGFDFGNRDDETEGSDAGPTDEPLEESGVARGR